MDQGLPGVTQNIASDAVGHQYQSYGGSQHINLGSGQQNNLGGATIHGGINFGEAARSEAAISKKELRETQNKRLRSLCVTPYKERKDRNPNRVEGTLEWFMHHDRFREWKSSTTSSLLWVSADPGSGKSVLAKRLIDHELVDAEGTTVCYFFFKDGFQDQMSATDAFNCILHQLFQQRRQLLSLGVLELFEDGGGYQIGSLQHFWDILILALSQDMQDEEPVEEHSRSIVCVLDAFDECKRSDQEDLAKILCSFYDSVASKSRQDNFVLKFLVTSRPYDDIRKGFQPINRPSMPLIHLNGDGKEESAKIQEEIKIYIRHEITSLEGYHKLGREDKETLLNKVLEIPNRTYLWVHLTLDFIRKEFKIKTRIERMLMHLPDNIDKAYEKMLARIQLEDIETARKLLHIVVAAVRPITVDEMNFALSLKKGDRTYDSVDLMPEEGIETYIRELCGLFVTIVDSKIYLLHQTAREFLVSKEGITSCDTFSDSRGPVKWKESLQPVHSHRILAQICLQHLNFDVFQSQWPDEQYIPSKRWNLSFYTQTRLLTENTFLDYSAHNWLDHVSKSETPADDEDLLSFFCIGSKDINTGGLGFALFWAGWDGCETSLPRDFTPLMMASSCGLADVAQNFLSDFPRSIDEVDCSYNRSALLWASNSGQTKVIQVLLKHSEKTLSESSKQQWVNLRDFRGRTALLTAGYTSQTEIIQYLIDHGADVNVADHDENSPLSVAANQLDVETVRLLIKSGANVNHIDGYCRSPLLITIEKATINGFHGSIGIKLGKIVRELLDAGADINLADTRNHTPVSLAATGEYGEVLQHLIDAGADINTADDDNMAPLRVAIEFGREDNVRRLIEANVSLNSVDCEGRTALWWAANLGNVACVKQLIEAGADLKRPNNRRITPLIPAIEAQSHDIFDLLINAAAETAGRRHESLSLDEDIRFASRCAIDYRWTYAIRRFLEIGVIVRESLFREYNGARLLQEIDSEDCTG